MTKSNNTQITDILNNIYNLILNPETTEEERNLLVTFKNEIEDKKKDNGELLAELRRAIQVLAVDNLSKGISLSSGLSELSKTLTEFQNESERNNNLAIGLSSIAMFFRWFICLWCLIIKMTKKINWIEPNKLDSVDLL